MLEVSVNQLAAACRLADTATGIRPELAGAAGLAAASIEKRRGLSVCVVSGGNIDPSVWQTIVERRVAA